MLSFLGRVRVAGFGAVIAILLVTGAAAAAAGSALILGQSNSAGTSTTTITAGTSGSGVAFKAVQTSAGTAIRGEAGAGIAGFFLSNGGSGVSGVVNNGTSGHFGVYAEVSSGVTSPSNAALRAKGNNAVGAVITSTDNNGLEVTSVDTAITGTATGCDSSAFICFGYDGVAGYGGGIFGAGVYGNAAFIGVDGNADFFGTYGSSSGTTGIGAFGTSTNYTGVWGEDGSPGTIDVDCSDACDWAAPGVLGNGFNGVIGNTSSAFGVGVVGRTTVGLSYAGYFDGFTYVNGDLTIAGTCTGCAVAQIAFNGSNQTLKQGDAVTLIGVRTDANGAIVLTVGPAKKGDAILGVVDRSITLGPAKVTVPSSSKTTYGAQGQKIVTKSNPYSFVPASRLWETGGTSAAAGGYLRIVTSGLFAFKPAATISAVVGDSLAVGASSGLLSKATSDTVKGATAGRYLGSLSDGRIVLLIQPS